MATPAEIIAARVNGTYLAAAQDEPVSSKPSSKSTSVNEETRCLSDESAFPVLGGGAQSLAGSSVSTSWGPSSNGKSPVSYASSTNTSSKAAVNGPKFKSSSIQLAFSLDAEDQSNIARPEFIKIMNSIKASTSSSIECTTSQHTKKRTFLITGKPEQAKQAKRLIIKKLTKPVVISFVIPAKTRAKVIGAQGRNLKPIIQENEVKIDIGQFDGSASPSPVDDEDDIYAQTVNVAIEGDVEGCKQAKAQIMAIVNEDLKNSQVRVLVDGFVKPFVAKALGGLVSKYPDLDFTFPPYGSSSKSIIIVGDREDSLAAKEEAKELIQELLATLVIELVAIPKTKFSFIPVTQVLEEDNVLVELPEDEDSPVKFIGEKANIAPAQAKVKSIIAQFKVETMDMSKAHKGNIPHVRAVAAMFTKYGIFDAIAKEYGIKINSPVLNVAEIKSIPIEIIVKTDEPENTKNARRAIVTAVNKVTPDQTLEISDIDSFFHSKIPGALDEIAGAKYVILDDSKIYLFDYSSNQSDDFEDFEDSFAPVLAECQKALEGIKELQSTLSTFVLQVPSAQQIHIKGPNGTTLRTILASAEPGSVVIKLHSNASGVSKNEVLIKGLKAEASKVQKDILEIVEEAEEYSATGGYSTTFEVPTFVLARVIGKGGSKLNSLRDEFGIKIDIAGDAKNSENVDKSLRTEITVNGIKRNAEGAKDAIKKLANKLADDTLVRLRIENQYHRRIAGPNFTYVNRLEDRYNVKIKFPSDTSSNYSDAPNNENEITIRGPSKNVARAEDELKQLYTFEKENGHKSSIRIPSKAVARVIGKSGAMINDISDATGVDCKFNKSPQKDADVEFVEVELTGSKSALKEATQKIQEIVSDVENSITVSITVDPKYHRDLVGPSGSVLREIISNAGGNDLSRQEYHRLLTIPNEGAGSDQVVCQGNKLVVNKIVDQIKNIIAEKEASIKVEYELAKEKHKLIVGPGGSIRKSLEEEFGVQIYIPKVNEASNMIELTGLPEKIEKLKVKLDEITKDNWNESIDIPVIYHAMISNRGATIKSLRFEHNVEVSYGKFARKASSLSNASIPAPPEGSEPADESATNFVTKKVDESSNEGSTIPWRLMGEAEATAKAAQIIESQLARARLVTTAGWFYSKNPSAHFPKIVGPQGSKINKIRQASGAFITVPRTNEKYNNFIYLVGTDESLQKANEEFLKVL
ncbi:hypothetical protein METBIDRAFT_33095 [Metschnikowia bicuspidata var. bicuspidata NRRL YB-4993]|uniref:K Homology domain-containing protein n=1 Tax=Metschnikowia bicuspidata var. bicuspidata NRRL YB-4993 TaxID=869754 RepID=A0A1A0H806_9ASCO|nr:hypothetical protein METBIDRAFT_33095 [Metschnikowia bicuspidata var. bicuspidata NRRL YB-4993]OBA20156.1 hypothetical protein METBIDRAFT_33095 [Metschnikowia bicuspidata var. bicuspidata NRRL YB-4993]